MYRDSPPALGDITLALALTLTLTRTATPSSYSSSAFPTQLQLLCKINMGAPVDVREINGSDLISALHLAQQAPAILGPNPTKATTSTTGTAEEYSQLEQLFLACLRTGDDQSAQACLDRLTHRFGPANERVMGLCGLYQEATAKDRAALEKCLEEYEKILSESPVNAVRSDPCQPLQPGSSSLTLGSPFANLSPLASPS